MDTLLGFVVLTGPLVPIILWSIFVFWLSKKVVSRIDSDGKRKITRVLILVVIGLLPFSDSMIGHIYFNHLCETEAGAKVYQTIELPAEYWDEDGKPRFMNSRGILDTKILGDRFEWKQHTNPVVSGLIRIDQKKWILYDNQSDKELGEKIDFIRYFGWINTFSPAPNVSESCLNYWADKYGRDGYIAKEASIGRGLMHQIFPSPAHKIGGSNGSNY